MRERELREGGNRAEEAGEPPDKRDGEVGEGEGAHVREVAHVDERREDSLTRAESGCARGMFVKLWQRRNVVEALSWRALDVQ